MSIVGFSGQSPRFSPQDVPGLSLWLDAADAGTVTRSGSNVTSWQDKSGFQNHATSRDGFPTYTTSGINGRPALTFSNAPSMTGTLSITGATLTGFLMIQGSQSGSGRNDQRIVSCATSGAADWNSTARFLVGIQGGGNVVRYNRGNSIIPQTTIPIGSPALLIWQSDGTSNFIWEDGSAGDVLASVANGDTFSITNYGLGNQFTATTETYNGLIGEVLLYTSSLTTFQRRSVESYLARKWGTTATLVPGHPARSSVTPMRSFVPTDLDGCALWIDALDSNAYTLSGSNVTAVFDKSPNAWSLGSATNFTMNSTPFNGTYPSFYGTGGQLGSNGSFTLSQPMTIYFVGQAITFNASTFLFDGASSGRVVIYAGAQLFAGGEFVATNRASAVPNPHVMVAVVNGASSSIILNGVTTTGNPGTNSFGGIRLSSRNTGGDPYIGHICELLIFSGAHTDAQTQLMTGYLNSKWGLRNLAMGGTTHPFRYGPPMGVIPSTISGCTLWLDGADSTSITLSGSNVTQWNDKSGSGRHAVAQTAATYDASAMALRFSGTNYYSFNNFSFAVGSNFSFFFAERVQTGSNDRPFVATDQTGIQNACPHIVLATPNGPQQIKFAYWGNDLFLNGIFTYTTAAAQPLQVWSLLQTSTGRAIYLNGTLLTSDTNTTLPTAWPTPLLGRSFTTNYYNGFMHEVLAFGGSMGTAQRQQIEGYLGWKWGRSTAFPGPSTNWIRFYRPLFPEFMPLQIPGCSLWLDAADAATLTLSGSNVTQWNDKSGNNYHAVAAGTPTRQTQSNGLVGLVANSTSAFGYSNATPMNTTSNLSAFVVASRSSVYGTYRRLFGVTNEGVADHTTLSGGVLFEQYNDSYGMTVERATGAPVNTVSITSNVLFVGASIFGPTTGIQHINGQSNVTTTYSSTAFNYTRYGVGQNGQGTGERWEGVICELVAYNALLSGAERQRMEGYLAWKWGTTSSLPSSHPFKRTKP